MTEQKASDLLIELLAGQKEILGRICNIELTNKIIANKLQTMEKVQADPEFVQSDFEPKAQPKQLEPKLEPQEKPKSQLQIALEMDEHEQEAEEMGLNELNPGAQKRASRYNDSAKKVPVEQRITYQDGKNVYMANVEIFDSLGALVKKTRTNQTGKWLAGLAPGSYQIRIEKAASSLKTKVELQYGVVVPNSDSRVELEVKKA